MRHGLGRNASPKDERDYKLSAFIPKYLGNLSGSKKWDFLAEPLNQGETPHCVGFGGANFGINLPIQDNYTNQDGHDFYYKCKVIDGEPNAENGSTVRSIAKVLQQAGRIKNYAFASSIDEIDYWLLNNGPLIVGVDWYNDMFTPDENNQIHIGGAWVGGHCGVINELMETGFYFFQNSWGGWGIHGGAKIAKIDFEILMNNQGEAMTAVELPLGNPEGSGCPLGAILKTFGLKV
jgi:hypothetical protein